ncbi:extracellular solute-binding protein [Steroidobacter sp.]|uniref:extracellular solute-binding protein n=1 Tax=Steroidobacter sp. TaxID=1978227 RepID=UPI001A3A11CF|nr:extracellular solute-binding protein [Steroidobacter sp.]MBL8265233.1 extracellular solute-binding protein [Steroidobacter sp.]
MLTKTLTPLLLGLLLLTGCSKPHDDGKSIIVATYGGGWADRIQRLVASEMDARGIKVTYVDANAQAAMAKLIAARGGPPPFDIMELDDQTYTALRSADYLERLDLANIPRTAEIIGGSYDQYRVAFWVNQPGLIYNADRLREAGVEPPQHLADLANPRLARRVMLGDLGHYTGLYGLTQFIFEGGGSIEQPQPGFDALAKINPHSYFTSASLIGQLFETGELWAAVSTDGAAARFQKSGLNMGMVHLQGTDGRIMVARGYFGRPKGSRNPAAAEAFINALLSAESQLAISRETGMIPVNREALREVAREQREGSNTHRFSNLDEQTLSNGYVPPYERIDLRDWTRRFQSAVAAQPR